MARKKHIVRVFASELKAWITKGLPQSVNVLKTDEELAQSRAYLNVVARIDVMLRKYPVHAVPEE